MAENTQMSFDIWSVWNFLLSMSFVVESDFFSELPYICINMSSENQKLPLLGGYKSKNVPTLLKLFNINLET